MRPFLSPGQEIVLRTDERGRVPRHGEVAAFRKRGTKRFVVHRVCRTTGRKVVTKGDNSRQSDPIWCLNECVGTLLAAKMPTGEWRRPKQRYGRVVASTSKLPRKLSKSVQFLLSRWAWENKVMYRSIVRKRIMNRLSTLDSTRFEVQQLGKEVAIYDLHKDALHILNRTAYSIWEKVMAGLDNHTVLDEMKLQYPQIAVETLQQDIQSTRNVLIKAGLL